MQDKKRFTFLKDKKTNKLLKRTFNEEIWDNLQSYNYYNENLIKLIKRMLVNDINFRPTSSQCYDELQYIKKIIKDPNDEDAKTFLENKNNPKKKEANKLKIIIPEQKNNEIKHMATQVNNNNVYNNNNNNTFINTNINNNIIVVLLLIIILIIIHLLIIILLLLIILI